MEDQTPAPTISRIPEKVALTEEQERSYAATVEQAREAELAKRLSMPTKLLGWLMIAGLIFDVTGAAFDAGPDFGGIIALFIGIRVLKGSQTALRLATFLLVLSAFFSLAGICWASARQLPIEIGRHWVDWHDIRFWTLGVSPAVYVTAGAILAITSLRLRHLAFWTKTVRLWAWIVLGLLLLKGAFEARDTLRDQVVRRELVNEVKAARDHFSVTGGWTSGSAIRSVNDTFDGFPRVKTLKWHGSTSSTMNVYDRFSRAESRRNIATGKSRLYSEWVKTPSGKWGRFELEVILPETP